MDEANEPKASLHGPAASLRRAGQAGRLALQAPAMWGQNSFAQAASEAARWGHFKELAHIPVLMGTGLVPKPRTEGRAVVQRPAPGLGAHSGLDVGLHAVAEQLPQVGGRDAGAWVGDRMDDDHVTDSAGQGQRRARYGSYACRCR
jgi:hypothetical protein